MQRFGYIDTTRGQVHYREAGRGPAVLLLHWAPGSSRQYAAAVEAFAAEGFRAIAPDLPGFGSSCRREGHWSIGDFADNVLECMNAWGVVRCALVGGHISSEIALEAAIRAPGRFAMVALDGTPTWDDALRQQILAKATPRPIELREDGAHLQSLWQHMLWEVKMWRPNAHYDTDLGRYAMKLLNARMQAGFDMRPARALLEYDVFAALAAVRVPVLALTATDDPLHNCHATVLERVSGATGHCYAGDHPVHSRARAAEFIAPIVARYRELLPADSA